MTYTLPSLLSVLHSSFLVPHSLVLLPASEYVSHFALHFSSLPLCTENGFLMVLWVGQQLSADFITKVFGAASHSQINTEMVSQWLAVFSFPGLPTAACICTVAESCSGRIGVEVSLKDDCVCTSNVVQFCLPFSLSLSLSLSPSLSSSSLPPSLPPSLQHALPALDNTLSFRVRGILARLQNRRQFSMRVSCCTLRGTIPSECLLSSRVYSLSLSHTHTHTHACTRTHMHTHIHTHTHACTHTHMHTHMHTHTHTHSCLSLSSEIRQR